MNFGTENITAADALAAQMKGYTFKAYTTGTGNTGLHTTTYTRNSTWLLKFKVKLNENDDTETTVLYRYSVCPFFADSMALTSIQYDETDDTTEKATDNPVPGAEGNTYEIRSVAQLQFINWNSITQSTDHSITSGNYAATGTEQVKSTDWWGNTKQPPKSSTPRRAIRI